MGREKGLGCGMDEYTVREREDRTRGERGGLLTWEARGEWDAGGAHVQEV